MSPAITRPEFKPTRNRRATPSRCATSPASCVGLLLDGHRGHARAKSVILQRNWSAKDRHHPVAGVLHGAAVALHHRRRPLHDFGHDFAQPLHVQGGRDVHRPLHVGEQHRDLFVLSRTGCLRESRTALATKLARRRNGMRAAGPTDQPRRGQSTTTIPADAHVIYRFTAGQ